MAKIAHAGATAGLSSSPASNNNPPMNDNKSIRKRVKHFEDRKCVHELTFSCYRRLPLLTNAEYLQMLSEAVSRASDRHNFDLLAFVWMPKHVHLLVLPRTTESSISALLNAIKRPFSYRIKQLLIKEDSPLLQKLTVRQRPGVMTFRFWQEGGGYDRNLWSDSSRHRLHPHESSSKRVVRKAE